MSGNFCVDAASIIFDDDTGSRMLSSWLMVVGISNGMAGRGRGPAGGGGSRDYTLDGKLRSDMAANGTSSSFPKKSVY